MTAVGQVAFTRRYWKCTCGQDGSYAADELLGVSGQRYTKSVRKHCCRLAADASFASTSEHLHELLGVDVSPETTRAMASVGPPAEAGTIMVTGREGQDWAMAGDAAAKATTLAATRSHRRGGFIVSSRPELTPQARASSMALPRRSTISPIWSSVTMKGGANST